MTKKKSEAAKPSKNKSGIPVSGVWGIVLLIIGASIMYANYRVYFGVDDLLSQLMLLPSTLAVAAFLIYKALK